MEIEVVIRCAVCRLPLVDGRFQCVCEDHDGRRVDVVVRSDADLAVRVAELGEQR